MASGAFTGSSNTYSSSTDSGVLAGYDNSVNNATYSGIVAGYKNECLGASAVSYGFIGGGQYNQLNGPVQFASIVGGMSNKIYANADESIIGGGSGNVIQTTGATHYDGSGIFSSRNSTITGAHNSVIVSGYDNDITKEYYAFIGAGQQNSITNTSQSVANCCSAIVAGSSNVISNANRSFIGAGVSNEISGSYAAIHAGYANKVTADYAIASGKEALASQYGEHAQSSGQFASKGDAQKSSLVLRKSITTQGTWEKLYLDGSSEELVIPANAAWALKALVMTFNDNGSDAEAAEVQAIARRDGSGSVTVFPWVHWNWNLTVPEPIQLRFVANGTDKVSLEVKNSDMGSGTFKVVANVELLQIIAAN